MDIPIRNELYHRVKTMSSSMTKQDILKIRELSLESKRIERLTNECRKIYNHYMYGYEMVRLIGDSNLSYIPRSLNVLRFDVYYNSISGRQIKIFQSY